LVAGAAIETGTVERVKARLEQLCEQFEGTLFKRIEETKVVFPISAKGYIEFLGELEKIGVKRDKVAFLHRLIETFQSTIVTLIKSRQGKREDEVEKANQLVGSICDALIHLSSEMGDSQGAFKSALDSIQAEAVKAEQDRVIELKDKISPIYVTELKDKISPIHVRAQRFQEEVHRYWPRATPPEPRAHASELLQLSVECKNDEKDMKVISTELEMLRGHLNGLSRLGIIRSDSVTFSDLNDLERVVERINGLNEHSEDILTMHKQHFSIYFNAVDENN
jgi:hypothetical protein